MGGLERGFGLDVVLWLQSPVLERVLLPFHYLGSEEFYLVLLPAVYWCLSERFGRRLTPLFLLSCWTNAFLKECWQRPRPYQVSTAVERVVEGTGFGIPSGHAQNAVVVGGAVSLETRSRQLGYGVVVYVLLMGISRMVHGVHFPQDVLAGWVIGGGVVAAYPWLEPSLSAWVRGLGLASQVTLALGVTTLGLAIARDELAVAALGTFLGASWGFALETRFVRFRARGPFRLKRFLVGFLLLILIYAGLGIVTHPWPALQFLRYTAVGLWVGVGAPWLFVKTGLATSSHSSHSPEGDSNDVAIS